MKRIVLITSMVILGGVVIYSIQNRLGNKESQENTVSNQETKSQPETIPSTQTKGEYQTFTDQEFGFSFEYPKGWQVGESQRPRPLVKDVFTHPSLPPDTFIDLQITVTISTQAKEEYIEKNINSSYPENDRIRLRRSSLVLSNQDATKVDFTGNNGDDIRIVLVRGNYTFEIKGLFLTNEYRSRENFNHIVESFKFKN